MIQSALQYISELVYHMLKSCTILIVIAIVILFIHKSTSEHQVDPAAPRTSQFSMFPLFFELDLDFLFGA